MKSPFNIKQGEPLHLTLQITQDDGTPIDISNAQLFSEIRDVMNDLVATPMLTVTNGPQGLVDYRTISDATWPCGRVRSDIGVSFGGINFITETFFIGVSAPVTNVADAGR